MRTCERFRHSFSTSRLHNALVHADDRPLRDDIHLLGDLLGETLRAQ